MAARRRLAVVEKAAERERAPDLRDAVRDALDAMTWLTPSDQAMKSLVLRLAEEIETTIDRAQELAALRAESNGEPDIYRRLDKLVARCDVTKTVGWLGPQLQNALRDLGGTPVSRSVLGKGQPVGSRLAQLRSAAANAED